MIAEEIAGKTVSMPNILVIGKMFSGKTTVADYLVETCGYSKYSFASSLKEEAIKLLGRPIDKSKDRKFMQDLGAEGRAKDTLYWIKQVGNKITTNNKLPFVIDDCRFINEAKWGQSEFDCCIVKLITPTDLRWTRASAKWPALIYRDWVESHEDASEKEQDDIRPDLVWPSVSAEDLTTIASMIAKYANQEM